MFIEVKYFLSSKNDFFMLMNINSLFRFIYMKKTNIILFRHEKYIGTEENEGIWSIRWKWVVSNEESKVKSGRSFSRELSENNKRLKIDSIVITITKARSLITDGDFT